MRFGSSSPRQHHHAHHHNHRPPLAYFLNEDGEQVQVAPARVKVVEYEYEYGRAPPGTQEENRYGAYEENVDREAEEFIRMEHKKFEKIKVMSMKSE